MERAKVLIADDHTIVAQGLESLLREDYHIVAVVGDGPQLLEIARSQTIDVIIADLSMPTLTGLDVLRQLKKDGIKTRLILLTMHSEPQLVREAIEAGAAGYLLKDSAGEELCLAIQEVLKGRIYISPALTQSVISVMGRSDKEQTHKLTPRQQQVLRLISEGRSMKEIAAILEISPRTVETYKYDMMEILGIKTTAELIRYAIRKGSL